MSDEKAGKSKKDRHLERDERPKPLTKKEMKERHLRKRLKEEEKRRVT